MWFIFVLIYRNIEWWWSLCVYVIYKFHWVTTNFNSLNAHSVDNWSTTTTWSIILITNLNVCFVYCSEWQRGLHNVVGCNIYNQNKRIERNKWIFWGSDKRLQIFIHFWYLLLRSFQYNKLLLSAQRSRVRKIVKYCAYLSIAIVLLGVLSVDKWMTLRLLYYFGYQY